MAYRGGHRIPARPRVLIVGGGFAGLEAARKLGNRPVDVTLVDRSNHHVFQPLLYQVATGALSPGNIAAPIRSILRRYANVRVLLGTGEAVNLAARQLHLADGAALEYDYLVLAPGSRHSYFGHDEWEPIAPGLKTIADALEMRRRVLLAFELAEREPDAAERQALLTFVIVGGGPTGVELAGTLAEVARLTLAHDYRSINPRQTRILLIEGGPRLLATFPEDLSARAERDLAALGVVVRTGTEVTAVTPKGVIAGGEQIPARVILWAAGNAASPLARSLGVPLDRAGRVSVAPDLSVPEHPEVFVAGDLALFTHYNGRPLPGTADVAKQEGVAAAANILRRAAGRPTEPFRLKEKGNLAVIGRGSAVIDFGRVHLTGFIAWLFWLFAHIFFLIGFQNRLLVFWQWAWSFFTYERGARLIVGPAGPRGLPEMDEPAYGPIRR